MHYPFSKIIKVRYFDRAHPWHFMAEEIKKMFQRASLKEEFTHINAFHWRARNPLKHLIAKAIIRNYFAILKKDEK